MPEQLWFNNAIITILVGGILPFGAVFVEVEQKKKSKCSSLWKLLLHYLVMQDFFFSLVGGIVHFGAVIFEATKKKNYNGSIYATCKDM